MKSYNGHRSWNAWNVSLWIDNDYNTYVYARDLVKDMGITRAVRCFVHNFDKTPDGAVYNALSVRLALEAFEE